MQLSMKSNVRVDNKVPVPDSRRLIGSFYDPSRVCKTPKNTWLGQNFLSRKGRLGAFSPAFLVPYLQRTCKNVFDCLEGQLFVSKLIADGLHD